MSAAIKLLKAAAGNAGGGPVYVDDVFSTFLYEGNGTSQTITSGIDLDGKGGLVWTKARENTSGGATGHALIDTERGKTKWLSAEGTSAEQTNANLITAFNSNGHTVGSGGPYWTNDNGYDYVSWTFRKQPGFFDIVTYTGTGNTTGGSPQWREISHNLGTAPGMIIVKNTTGTGINNWFMWHRSVPDDSIYAASTGFLNTTSDFGGYVGFQTNANQTATHFSLRQNSSGQTNDSGETYVAYLFAHDAQDFGTDSDEAIIKCGSYTGDGSSSGVTVDVGFEPQWLFVKMYSHSGYYSPLVDSMRGIVTGGNDAILWPNVSAAEYSADQFDLTSSGFIATDTNNTNLSGKSYIYMAIRRPHKPASEFAATDLFAMDTLGSTGDGKEPGYRSGFPVDMGTRIQPSSSAYRLIGARLTQGLGMNTNNTEVEGASGTFVFDYNNGRDNDTSTDSGKMSHMWRRAPGYFDVVCYKGTGSFTWFNHNLGVVPEMIWFKGRDIAEHWNVFTTGGGTTGRLQLNDSNEYNTINQNQFWTNLPTATQFRVGQNNEINGSGYNYIAYLFASADGISKLGTYAGTGSAQNIDCGFSAGARFVLIKRVDQAGFWILFDSLRGIVAGNDPYLFLNNYAAQVTNTDYIDPISSGFTITSSAPTDNSDTSMNKSGGTYFFYAIA